jgi:hypothetical protein
MWLFCLRDPACSGVHCCCAACVVRIFQCAELSYRVQMPSLSTQYPYSPNIKKEIGMVAGGTGITPMLQVCWGGGLAEEGIPACQRPRA